MRYSLFILLLAFCCISAEARTKVPDYGISVTSNANWQVLTTEDQLDKVIETLDARIYAAPTNAAEVSVDSSGWSYLSPTTDTIQATFDFLDSNSFSTNSSYTYADGTTQSVDGLIVRGSLTLPTGSIKSNDYTDASIYANHLSSEVLALISTNNAIMGNSYLGFSRLSLSTNANPVTAYGSATMIASSDYQYFLDGNLTTSTPTNGVGVTGTGNCSHSYLIDLGENYTGYLFIFAHIVNTSASYAAQLKLLSVMDGATVTTLNSAVTPAYPATDSIQNNASAPILAGMPFTGRRVGFLVQGGVDVSASNAYWVYEVLVYGSVSSNALTEIGGLP